MAVKLRVKGNSLCKKDFEKCCSKACCEKPGVNKNRSRTICSDTMLKSCILVTSIHMRHEENESFHISFSINEKDDHNHCTKRAL